MSNNLGRFCRLPALLRASFDQPPSTKPGEARRRVIQSRDRRAAGAALLRMCLADRPYRYRSYLAPKDLSLGPLGAVNFGARFGAEKILQSLCAKAFEWLQFGRRRHGRAEDLEFESQRMRRNIMKLRS